jgi:Protein of unknown function (DUF3341)
VYLMADFREQPKLEAAILALKAAGIDAADMDVFSEEPVEFRSGILDRPSSMSLVAVLGAIVTGGLATAGVYAAQHNYQLTTGGMPIFSFWGTGVITYETTMLGSVLATFGWFLWESGLLRKRDKSIPVPTVLPGVMCLRVRCFDPHVTRVRQILDSAGATDIARKEVA